LPLHGNIKIGSNHNIIGIWKCIKTDGKEFGKYSTMTL
jgi:hypothetical protein